MPNIQTSLKCQNAKMTNSQNAKMSILSHAVQLKWQTAEMASSQKAKMPKYAFTNNQNAQHTKCLTAQKVYQNA